MTRPIPSTARAWRILPILLILILAAVLRLRGIGDESLWGDEALTWLIARMSLPELIRHVVWWEQIPPVHHLLLWAWIQVFGVSETCLLYTSDAADE